MRSLKTQQSYYKVRLGVFLFVLIAASVLFMVSCKSPQPLLIESEKVLMETIREEVRDTVIVIKQDQALLKALLKCDSLGQVSMMEILEYQAGNRLKPPDVKIKDNVLEATAYADSLEIYLKLKDYYKERNEAVTITEYIEVNKLTNWQKIRIYIANAIFILLPMWIAYCNRSKLLTIIKKILK